MPSGHTNKKTIARKPMSPEMLSLLGFIRRRGTIDWKACSNIEKNRIRALMDRKLITIDPEGIISVTPKGKKELPK